MSKRGISADRILRLGAILAFLAVAFGAFGTHTLKARISPEALASFQTGVSYQLAHALAIVLVAALIDRRPEERALRSAAALFAFGILIFSGSLYVLAMTGARWLGAITPLGGVCFLAGWLRLATAPTRAA